MSGKMYIEGGGDSKELHARRADFCATNLWTKRLASLTMMDA
ncbi:MAG: hypothetical protein ACREJM_13255 [Candidatus Saccharimonadales bacterium]